MAPAANHRIQFRQGTQVKESLLFRSNRLAIAGTGFLALGMTGALFLVADILFHWAVAAIVSGVFALVFTALWYVWPALTRIREGEPT
jgi:hypothetical protein